MRLPHDPGAVMTNISGTCYTSVLTIPTPQYFNGTTVTCRDGTTGTLIGSDTLNIQLACKYSSNTHVWYSGIILYNMLDSSLVLKSEMAIQVAKQMASNCHMTPLSVVHIQSNLISCPPSSLVSQMQNWLTILLESGVKSCVFGHTQSWANTSTGYACSISGVMLLPTSTTTPRWGWRVMATFSIRTSPIDTGWWLIREYLEPHQYIVHASTIPQIVELWSLGTRALSGGS